MAARPLAGAALPERGGARASDWSCALRGEQRACAREIAELGVAG